MAEELQNVPTTKAYKNLDFLGAPNARHIRIMCELYEPMSRMRDHGVDNYFLIAGSHLVMHPDDRTKHVQELQEKVERGGPEEEVEGLRAKLRFAEKMQPMDKYYTMAMELSSKIAHWNKERNAQGKPSYHVGTGGGPGVMEAANRGASEVGELTVGFGANRPEWPSLNRYVSEEGAFEFHYFFMQKFWMAYKCMGLIVLPGGYGSLDELFELLCLKSSRKIHHRLPVVLLGEKHWKKVINFEYLLECGMLTQSHMDLFVFKDSAQEAFDYLINEVQLSEAGGDQEKIETAKRRRLEKAPSTSKSPRLGPTSPSKSSPLKTEIKV